MIRKPNGSDAKRLTTGVLVAGMVAVGAVALAGPASAATSGTITATASPTNNQINTSTTVSYTDTASGTVGNHPEATIISGTGRFDGTGGNASTAPQYPTGQALTGGSFGVTEATAGSTVVRVFNDANNDGSYTAGEDFVDLTLTYSNAPTNIAQTPATATATANNFTTFTDTTTTGNAVSGNAPVTVTLTESLANSATGATGAAAPALTIKDANGNTISGNTTAGTPGATNTVYTTTASTNTDGTGTLKFGATSNYAGSVAVSSNAGNGVSASSTLTITGGNSGDNAVAANGLTVNGNQTGSTNGSASFTATAVDSSGNPVGGATVYYQITSGPDAQAAGTYGTLGTTDTATGKVTGTINNGGTAGTDNITFFVNNTTGTGTHTPGPDSGDPKATATATFTAPTQVGTLTVTSPYDASGDVPAGTASVPFTATATNAPTGTQTGPQPVAGVQVTFTITDSSSTATQPTTQTATTGADGKATITVTPAMTVNGTTLSVSAAAGTATAAADAVTYQTRAATTFTLSPATQSVANGGTVTETATVTDQFGTGISGQSISYSVTGRNSGKTGTVTTGTNGTATISYTDAAVNSGSTTDTITAVDNSSSGLGTQTATVNYVASVTASTIALSGNVDSTNGAYTYEYDVSATSQNTITATVKNAAGNVLSNVPVTFSVDQGYVNSTTATSTDLTQKSVTVNTDQNGQASAALGSEQSGTQNLTVTSGAASAKATGTYDAGNPVSLTVTPTGVTVQPGSTQQFTAKSVDQFGNGANDYIYFSQTGPGALNNGGDGIYAPQGQASVILTVPANATPGSGTVTAYSDYNNNNSDTATATYTVPAPTAIASVTAYAAKGPVVGKATFASSLVTDSAGNPVSGEIVKFSITGSTVTSGTAVSDSAGRAQFAYTSQHAGSFTVTATSSTVSTATATATGTTAKATATTQLAQVSPQKYRIRDTATISVQKAGIQVDFYQTLASGSNKFIGSATTNASGTAAFTTYHLKSGYVFKGIAKVASGNADYTGPNSPTQTTTVK